MNHRNSGLAHGTKGSPQLTLDNQKMADKVKDNEIKVENFYKYDHNEVIEAVNKSDIEFLRTKLLKTSPIKVPDTAEINLEHKANGYEHVSYKWNDGEYIYESRWHTHVPTAPEYSQDTWVVERVRPGIGAGKNARPRIHEYFIENQGWVSYEFWDRAKGARKRGKETKEQRELLDNGHWNIG